MYSTVTHTIVSVAWYWVWLVCELCTLYELCPLVSQNDFGDTALITAVDHGHHKVVEILLNHGANVNLRNKVHVRPLMTISH